MRVVKFYFWRCLEDLGGARASRERVKAQFAAKGYDHACNCGVGRLPQISTDLLPDGYHWISDIFDLIYDNMVY